MRSKRAPGKLCGLLLAMLLATGGAGCVSKARARAEAQAAFAAGQREAMIRAQAARGPSVNVVGQVRNPFVIWTPDLTLARAIVEADYFGAADPRRITILRSGEEHAVNVRALLSGEDVPLDAGDVVRIE